MRVYNRCLSEYCAENKIVDVVAYADLEIEKSVEDRLVTAGRSGYVVPLAIFLCFGLR